ncbi:unnamed protein product [Lymnaea stagnalis]|uniref:PA domain-containing protein n=1 Tax=Lymnaea stagnalis TaxID=6523 RepID=A0AAV2IMJ6_LYMST
MATHAGYSPVRSEDLATREAAITATVSPVSGSNDSTKSKKCCCIGFGPLTVLILVLVIVFLLGVCLGFYVRESQVGRPDLNEVCKNYKRDDDWDNYQFGTFHETLVYSIRGENMTEFVDKFGIEEPASSSEFERELADEIAQQFNKYKFDSVDVVEYDIVITSADPQRPNRLEVLYHNGTQKQSIALTARNTNSNNRTRNGRSDPSEWTHPFVAFSPSGQVEGHLVYGHYGQVTDFQVLQASNVEVKGKIVLLRLGKIPVANKIKNVEAHGGKGVLLYWEPWDAENSLIDGYSRSYIPYASAAMFSTELPLYWTPSIVCQTVSADHARMLFSLLASDVKRVEAPSHWSGSVAKSYYLGAPTVENTNTSSSVSNIRVSVFNIPSSKKIKNIISTIQGRDEPDRYIIVGAPRAALPGQPQDVVASSSLLIQLANSFHHVHARHQWRPSRGVKLISWGGSEFSNMGLIQYLKSHLFHVEKKAVAYFDLSQLTVGDNFIESQAPPGLSHLITSDMNSVPDPKTGEFFNVVSADNSNGADPYNGDNCESARHLLLHTVGLQTVKVQYKSAPGVQNSVLRMLKEDQSHHFKYHKTVAHVLVKVLLDMIDGHALPINILRAAHHIHEVVLNTSEVIDDCSDSEEEFAHALELSEDLIKAAEIFHEIEHLMIEKMDSVKVRIMNDAKMHFDRLFIVQENGFLQNILYPTQQDGSIAVATELCALGEATEIWNATASFEEKLSEALRKVLSSLNISA